MTSSRWRISNGSWRPERRDDPARHQSPRLRLQLRRSRARPGQGLVGGLPFGKPAGGAPLGRDPGVSPADDEPQCPGGSLFRSWLERPQVQILQPGPRHLDLLDSLLKAAKASGNLTTDVHLAALAIEHQAELHTNDGDFSRFPGLRWTNPLQ